MSELAINQHGEAFAPPTEAAHWLVRRMHDNKHGGPMQTFGAHGKPITLPLGASLADFQAALRAHGCAAGRYRLDPLDAQGRSLKGAPVAYLPYPAERSTAPTIDAAELPRNGNHAPGAGAPWTGPAPLAWSTGGAFPLPAPAHLSGAEYLLGEAVRAQTAMLAIVAQSNAQISAQQAALLTAAAELVRAADGAKLPQRKPSAPAPAPQVIVQQVPVYDDVPDLADAEPEPAMPAAPAWQAKVGEVVDQLLPVAKMVIGQKMADMMGGGADVVPSGPMAPRNAADAGPEVAPAPEPEPEVEPLDVAPAAWSHLGAIVRRLGPAWKARIDAQLARMTAQERTAFVCSLVSLRMPAAIDHVVGAVSVAEQRQARAAAQATAQATAAAGTTPTAEPSATPPRTATSEIADDPDAPTDADLPAPMPAAGPAVQTAMRGIVADTLAQETPTATAPAAAPAPGQSALAGLYTTLAQEHTVIAPVLRRIPGGAATVEAAAALLGPDAVAQLNAAIDSVPDVPFAQLLPRAGASAPVPAPAKLSPEAMVRLVEVLPHLTPTEQTTAQTIATRLPAAERNALLARLVAVSVPEAVAIVRDAVAQYDTHGRPFG